MRSSARIAVSGITTALGLVILIFSSFMSTMTYSLAMIAGALLIVPICELGESTSYMIFFSTAVLSFLLPTDKSAVLMYLFLFGLYPIIFVKFDKVRLLAPRLVLKLVYFNIAAVLAVGLAYIVFRIPILEEGEGRWMLAVLLIVGNAAFILYDIALRKLVFLYKLKFSARFRRLFGIR